MQQARFTTGKERALILAPPNSLLQPTRRFAVARVRSKPRWPDQ